MEIFLKSLIIGIVNTTPLGPVGQFSLRRALNGSKRTGILTGLGVGFSNALFACAIMYGLQGIDKFLSTIQDQVFLRFSAGLFLIYLGVTHYLKPSDDIKPVEKFSAHHTVFITAFLFSLSNPSTFFAISSYFAVAGLLKYPVNAGTLGQACSGIFIGAFLMWAMITVILWRVRKKGSAKTLEIINHVTSFIIGIFGLIVIISCFIWN